MTRHGAGTLAIAVMLVAGCVAQSERDCTLPHSDSVRRNADSTVFASPLLSAAQVDSLGVYMGSILLLPEVALPEHAHPHAEEIVFVSCGSVQIILDGVEHVLEEGSALHIPAGAPHTAMAGPRGMAAVQVYRPGGPGLRFYDWTEVPGGS